MTGRSYGSVYPELYSRASNKDFPFAGEGREIEGELPLNSWQSFFPLGWPWHRSTPGRIAGNMKAPLVQSPTAPDSGILYPGVEICNCVHKAANGDLGGRRTMCSTKPSCKSEFVNENRRRPPNSIVTDAEEEVGEREGGRELQRLFCSKTQKDGGHSRCIRCLRIPSEEPNRMGMGQTSFLIANLLEALWMKYKPRAIGVQGEREW